MYNYIAYNRVLHITKLKSGLTRHTVKRQLYQLCVYRRHTTDSETQTDRESEILQRYCTAQLRLPYNTTRVTRVVSASSATRRLTATHSCISYSNAPASCPARESREPRRGSGQVAQHMVARACPNGPCVGRETCSNSAVYSAVYPV